MDKVIVEVEGTQYTVIGGEFWEMLEKIKAIPGRAYKQKIWSIPLPLDAVCTHLTPFQVVTDDKLLDAEFADIQRVQSRLIELSPEIERRTCQLDQEVKRYSYRSKSSVKAGLAHDSSLLAHALENASVALDKLTEPQIKTMYAALKQLGEE